MPKITIIREDNMVGVDGEFRYVNLEDMDPTIHAVQWDETSGEIERVGDGLNEPLQSIAPFQRYVDRWVLAGPPDPATMTELERAELELEGLYLQAVAEVEKARIDALIAAEAERVGGAPAAKAYVKGKTDIEALKAKPK